MTAEVVLHADRFQSTPDELRKKLGLEPALLCPRHGTKLWPAAGGSAMICVSKEGKDSMCKYAIGIDQRMMATAV